MAYGSNAPFGLRPIETINGTPWTGKLGSYHIYAPADGVATYGFNIFTGDPVMWNTSIAQAGTIGVYAPSMTNATPNVYSTNPVLGVFQGCEYTDAQGKLKSSPYWPASTAVQPGSRITAFVADGSDIVFDVQVSTNTNAPANACLPITNNTTAAYSSCFGRNAALDIGGGGNVVLNPATGNIKTGVSAFYLNGNSANSYDKTLATLPLKVIGYTRSPLNIPATGQTMATTPYLNVRVMLNNHALGHNVPGTNLI